MTILKAKHGPIRAKIMSEEIDRLFEFVDERIRFGCKRRIDIGKSIDVNPLYDPFFERKAAARVQFKIIQRFESQADRKLPLVTLVATAFSTRRVNF